MAGGWRRVGWRWVGGGRPRRRYRPRRRKECYYRDVMGPGPGYEASVCKVQERGGELDISHGQGPEIER